MVKGATTEGKEPTEADSIRRVFLSLSGARGRADPSNNDR